MTLVSTLYGGNYLVRPLKFLIERGGGGGGREREGGRGREGGREGERERERRGEGVEIETCL